MIEMYTTDKDIYSEANFFLLKVNDLCTEVQQLA